MRGWILWPIGSASGFITDLCMCRKREEGWFLVRKVRWVGAHHPVVGGPCPGSSMCGLKWPLSLLSWTLITPGEARQWLQSGEKCSFAGTTCVLHNRPSALPICMHYTMNLPKRATCDAFLTSAPMNLEKIGCSFWMSCHLGSPAALATISQLFTTVSDHYPAESGEIPGLPEVDVGALKSFRRLCSCAR